MNRMPSNLRRALIVATFFLVTSAALAATYGQVATGGGTANAENTMQCFEFTVGLAGETPATTVWYLNDTSASNTHAWKVGLYVSSTSALVAVTSERSDIATGAFAAYTFNFTTTPSLSNVAHRACMYASSAAGNAAVEKQDGVGTRYGQAALTYPTFPDPATFSSLGSDTMRATVTTNDPGGGGGNTPRAMHHYRQYGRTDAANDDEFLLRASR